MCVLFYSSFDCISAYVNFCIQTILRECLRAGLPPGPWQRKYSEHAVATRRVCQNLQQWQSGAGTEYRGDNTSQIQSGDTSQLQSIGFLCKSFLGQVTGRGHKISEALQIVYILEFKLSDRDGEVGSGGRDPKIQNEFVPLFKKHKNKKSHLPRTLTPVTALLVQGFRITYR